MTQDKQPIEALDAILQTWAVEHRLKPVELEAVRLAILQPERELTPEWWRSLLQRVLRQPLEDHSPRWFVPTGLGQLLPTSAQATGEPEFRPYLKLA